jgi:predicted flap endonuclease-1-like 5' DNA nuclease
MSMNETSATSASGLSLLPDGIATLTAIHFTIIAVVAILVIIGLLWGIKAKRGRVQASRDVIANAEEAGVPAMPVPDPGKATPDPRNASQSQRQAQTVAPVAPAQAQAQVPIQPQSEPERTPEARNAPAPISDIPRAAPPTTPHRMADEPIAAAAPPEARPATEITPPAAVEPDAVKSAPIKPTPIAPDPVESSQPMPAYADGPVTQLKGLGPKVAAQLASLGVATVGQMAALSESEAQRIDAQLGNFTGRMGRDRWIEQARLLAAGDKAGFESVFGKL